jgi:hypothetical protein
MQPRTVHAGFRRRVRRLEESVASKQTRWWFDFLKITFDKLLLALALLAAGFCFNKDLEDYRFAKAWSAEVARQTLATGNELRNAAYELQSRHAEAAVVARKTNDTFSAEYQSVLNAQNRAASELSAKIEAARSFLPEEVVARYEAYQSALMAVDLSTATSAAVGVEVALLSAVRTQTTAMKSLVLLTELPRTANVTPESLAEELKAALAPCKPPNAFTDTVQYVMAHEATLVGHAQGKAMVTWFDFDYETSMRYSVQALHGRGPARSLKPNTTYYYRYVVRNECGSSRGELKSFRTPPV